MKNSYAIKIIFDKKSSSRWETFRADDSQLYAKHTMRLFSLLRNELRNDEYSSSISYRL